MKTLLVFTLMLFVHTSQSINGSWETPQPDGNILGVVFKADDRFEGYINKKPFVSGTYIFRDGVITLNGNGCNMPGKYKIQFSANADSIRWEAIQDSCTERKKGLNNVVFKKIK